MDKDFSRNRWQYRQGLCLKRPSYDLIPGRQWISSNRRGSISPLISVHLYLLISFLTLIKLIKILKRNLEYHWNSQGLWIPVFLLVIYHHVCLCHCCALVVRKMKIVGVAERTSMKMVLTMCLKSMNINIQIFPGIAPWITLLKITTSR